MRENKLQCSLRPYHLVVFALAVSMIAHFTIAYGTPPIQAAQNGGRWLPHNQGIVAANVVGLTIDPVTPTTLYALTNQDGVYKSVDGGVTWVEKNRGLPANKVVKWGQLFANQLAMDPNDPDTLYIPIQGKIYKSTDGAENWFESSQGTNFSSCGGNGNNIAGILVDPRDSNHLYAGTVATGCNGGLFESMDAGANWQQIAGSNINSSRLDNEAWALAFDLERPNRMFIGSIKYPLFFSQNSGQTWGKLTPSGAAAYSRVVAIDPSSTRRIFLGNGNGLFILQSSNLGINVMAHALVGEDIWSVQFAPSDPRVIYVATAAGGFYKSTDSGRRWQQLGHTDKIPQSLAIHPLDPDIVYIGSAGAGMYQSSDGGQSFVARSDGLPFRAQIQALVRHPRDKNIFYANIAANGLYRTSDRGRTWVKISADATVADAFHLTINPADPNIIYSGDRVIKKSTDGGQTWTVILDPEAAFFRSFALDPNAPDTLFTVDSTNLNLYKSTDGGQTWARKRSYAPSSSVRVAESIVVDSTDSKRVYAASYDFLWKSADGGETWRRVTAGLEGISLANWIESITIDPEEPRNVYIATRANRVFKSVDFGETWTETGLFSQLPGKIVVDANDHNTLYVATLNGWFRSTDGGQTWVAQSTQGLPTSDFFQAKFAGLIQDAFDLGRFYIGTGSGGILVFDDEE